MRGSILSTLATMKSEIGCIFEVTCTGELDLEGGTVQVRVVVVETGQALWADVLNLSGGAAGAIVRKPRADEPGLIVCPRGDMSNAYFLGFTALAASEPAAGDELLWRVGDGETWHLVTKGGAVKLTARSATGLISATLSLAPSGAFELTNAGGSYLRAQPGGTVDMGGAAGSVLGLINDLITAITTATVATPNGPQPVVNPAFAILKTQLGLIKGA